MPDDTTLKVHINVYIRKGKGYELTITFNIGYICSNGGQAHEFSYSHTLHSVKLTRNILYSPVLCYHLHSAILTFLSLRVCPGHVEYIYAYACRHSHAYICILITKKLQL